ncbi:MAG: hypothetical protein H0V17_05735 [Deltaproteobacteria bacterium]|nr:hypothetical protein [Deltaproteobacteria bacterium]
MRSILAISLLGGCGVNQTPQPDEPPVLPSCVPNRDGVITADELPVPLGFTAAYYAGTDTPVMIAGTDAWDLSAELATDAVVALGPLALVDQWYAAEFPGAAFVTDAGGGLDGVFHQDAQALWLHGTASQEPAPAAGKTLVRYAEPIAVLRFPLTDGLSFQSTGDINGTIAGLPFIGADEVAVEIAGSGRLDLPYVRFSPVLRVRTQVVRRPSSGPAVGKRSTSFVFECFGEVAHADSKLDETNPDFTVAAALRRFALGVEP